jgi:hypothetical protein
MVDSPKKENTRPKSPSPPPPPSPPPSPPANPPRENGDDASGGSETVDNEQKGEDDSQMDQGEEDENDPDPNFVFYTRKEEGLELVSAIKMEKKTVPVYVRREKVGEVLRYFDCEESEEEQRRRKAGQPIEFYLPNFYDGSFRKRSKARNEERSSNEDSEEDLPVLKGGKPELMQVSYLPQADTCKLQPTTLEERERVLEELRAKEPDYTSELERRLNHMHTTLRNILDPYYVVRNEKAKLYRINQTFWSEAWKLMPAATSITISLCEPKETDHVIIPADAIRCGHVRNQRYFHVLLPQILTTMDNVWMERGQFGFEDGFFNFLAVFMEYGILKLNLTLSHSNREACYNE